ncbi:MAG: SPFH/Band 7/PHB domain protein [Bdellovibrionaceae bacterium]|nr:SPFH/Band 7/PHB domain protein [Bdellovibrionales bacterium]MCB9254030.1 SPFH/Band 7/PHB domain protein [Pseudobdellovibrionaceae bacterium]
MGLILLGALGLCAVVLLVSSIKIVKQSECVIIERLGRYHGTLSSGFNVILPFVDQPRGIFWVFDGIAVHCNHIDLRETVLDVPEQAVITRDNVSIRIDALLYIQIMDAKKATYEISNLPIAVGQLAQTSLRNVIGEMDLDQTLTSRDIINAKLKTILDEATDKWGTKVNRVELKNITPPREIQVAMEKQMQAERERRAKVLDAEGDKQARIMRSQGMKEEQINLADGHKESQIRRAQGEAEAIKQVADATKQAMNEIKSAVGESELTTQYLLASKYIEAFSNFVQRDGDKVFIPYEASTALSSLGSIKEILAGGAPAKRTRSSSNASGSEQQVGRLQ